MLVRVCSVMPSVKAVMPAVRQFSNNTGKNPSGEKWTVSQGLCAATFMAGFSAGGYAVATMVHDLYKYVKTGKKPEGPNWEPPALG